MAKTALHKDNLVQAAAKLFREQGYAATGLNEVLSKSGAPKGSLYYYYPEGKVALGVAAITLSGKGASLTLQNLRTQCKGPADFIEQYAGLLAGWMETSGFRSGCPIATILLETCPNSSKLQSAGTAVFEQWLAIISGVFLDSGYEAEEAAAASLLVISSLEGALILSRTLSSSAPLRDVGRQLARLLSKSF